MVRSIIVNTCLAALVALSMLATPAPATADEAGVRVPNTGSAAQMGGAATFSSTHRIGTGLAEQCRYEGQNGCVWHALSNGNGRGMSYIATPNGRVIYVRHDFAGRLIYGNPAARHEDSPGVWDARHRGNGRGRSLITTPNGRRVFVSHTFAHRLTHF